MLARIRERGRGMDQGGTGAPPRGERRWSWSPRENPALLVALPVIAAIRLMMLVPILAVQAAAVGLLAFGALEAWHFVADLWAHGFEARHDEVLYGVIEIIDLFLVATVAEVVSLGLYQLYFRAEPNMPAWLRVETLEDLKSKLVGVTVTVLAVSFLGRALVWEGGEGIAFLGVGVAAVVAALTWFLGRIEPH
jgi:uncharacterized membrane protein YqhA